MKRCRPAWWHAPDVSETDLLQFCRGAAERLAGAEADLHRGRNPGERARKNQPARAFATVLARPPEVTIAMIGFLIKPLYGICLQEEEHYAEIIRRTQVNRS